MQDISESASGIDHGRAGQRVMPADEWAAERGRRAVGQRGLALVTGIAAALVITVPQFRPLGVPVAYVFLFAVLVVAVLVGLRIPRQVPPLLAVWAVPVAYAVAHDVVVAAGDTLQLFVRNTVALAAAWMLAATMRDGRRAMAALAGMGLVMLVDSVLGIGQALGADWAIFGSLPFASEEIVEGVLAGERSLAVFRSWGIHSYVHMYAYTISMWVFISFAWVACMPSAQSRLKPIVVVAFLVGVAALVFSAQRSAVGSAMGSVLIVLLLTARSNPRLLLTILAAGLIAGGLVLSLLAEDAPLALDRLVAGGDVVSDSARSASWVEGWRVLEEDPYLGTAFGSYGGRIGIHNSFLGGWAQYGLPWLVLVCVAIVVTCWYFLTAWQASLPARVSALLLVGIMFANAMFHTTMPTVNDMSFLVLMGPMLALVSSCSDLRGKAGARPCRDFRGASTAHRMAKE